MQEFVNTDSLHHRPCIGITRVIPGEMRAPDAALITEPAAHGQQDAVNAPEAGTAGVTRMVLADCPPKIPPDPKSPPPLFPLKKSDAREGF